MQLKYRENLIAAAEEFLKSLNGETASIEQIRYHLERTVPRVKRNLGSYGELSKILRLSDRIEHVKNPAARFGETLYKYAGGNK